MLNTGGDIVHERVVHHHARTQSNQTSSQCMTDMAIAHQANNLTGQ